MIFFFCSIFLFIASGGCAAHLQNLAGCGSNSMADDILSEEPHTVLVEFSSVVADTQEYIIEVTV